MITNKKLRDLVQKALEDRPENDEDDHVLDIRSALLIAWHFDEVSGVESSIEIHVVDRRLSIVIATLNPETKAPMLVIHPIEEYVEDHLDIILATVPTSSEVVPS